MTSHRMQQLLGKRRRAYEEMEFDLGAPQPLDLPSARRLRTVEPRSHAAYMSDSMVGYHSHSHAYPRYHHHPAASLGEDEQAYLYRMRPEVREEVMAPLLHRVRDRAHLYSQPRPRMQLPTQALKQHATPRPRASRHLLKFSRRQPPRAPHAPARPTVRHAPKRPQRQQIRAPRTARLKCPAR